MRTSNGAAKYLSEFFYESIMAICKMAKSLDDFITNDKKLLQAIESRAGLLLGNG